MSSRSSIITATIIVLIIFGGVAAYLFATEQYDPSRIAVVTVEPGFGDRSMADQALVGLQALQADITVAYTFAVVDTVAEAEAKLKDLAATRYFDLIIALGKDMVSAMTNAAVAHPTQKFAIIGGEVNRPNVASAIFNAEEAAFLAGVLAALLITELDPTDQYPDTIGILASLSTDSTVQDMIYGFTEGVKAINETYNLTITIRPPVYLNSYNDSISAQIWTQSLFLSYDVGLVFAPVRASIVGVRQGAITAESSWVGTRKPYVIAGEGNQDYYGLPDPDIRSGESWIPTSVVMQTDLAIYDIINMTLWDNFPGGQTFLYNLEFGGVNITNFEYSHAYIPVYVRNIINEYRMEIIAAGGLDEYLSG